MTKIKLKKNLLQRGPEQNPKNEAQSPHLSKPKHSFLILQKKVLKLKQDLLQLSFMIKEINQVVDSQNRIKNRSSLYK